MRLLLINLFILTVISCSDETPECNDEQVKDKILKMYINENKPIVIDTFLEKLINYEDINNYAWDRGLDADILIQEKEEELSKKYENKINSLFSDSKIKNVRTKKINYEIKKCICSADIITPSLDSKRNITYTVQKLEDDETGYWFEIYYN